MKANIKTFAIALLLTFSGAANAHQMMQEKWACDGGLRIKNQSAVIEESEGNAKIFLVTPHESVSVLKTNGAEVLLTKNEKKLELELYLNNREYRPVFVITSPEAQFITLASRNGDIDIAISCRRVTPHTL